MSMERNHSGNSTQSGSSPSSPNRTPFFQEHIVPDVDLTELSLCGVPAPRLFRSGTVKRAYSTPIKRERLNSGNGDSENVRNDDRAKSVTSSPDQSTTRYRKQLDSAFRRSLDSISEHKAKRCFSPTPTLTSTSRECSSSMDSFSSDPADYHAIRSNSGTSKEEKTIQSPGSSYLTWIESVKSDYFGSAITAMEPNVDVDGKVGEWNNFWLNYNNARSRYVSSSCPEDKAVDDNSELKSTASTQKGLIDKTSNEVVALSLEEIREVMKCSKRITDIFQGALVRNDYECENSKMENSYYSDPFSRQNSLIQEECKTFTKEDFMNKARERSSSYIITSHDLLRQKESLRPSVQSSSTSCINAILNSSVSDILKRVINKRRDVISDDHSSMTRRSFSEWSSK